VTIDTRIENPVLSVVRSAVNHHGARRDALIPILGEINHELGYLPADAMTEVCRLLQLPASGAHSVATFYSLLSTRPRGRHVIRFCENAPCHVVGGRRVWQALRDALRLKEGETSPDGRWTLVTTSCIGLCAVGPVLVIDDDVYGNIEAGQVPDILARYA
jgi:NADH-quinone oxidoreductase subunit E